MIRSQKGLSNGQRDGVLTQKFGGWRRVHSPKPAPKINRDVQVLNLIKG